MTKPKRYLALCAILGAASPVLLAQPDRIAGRVDNSQSVVLSGRVPRSTLAATDAGPVDPSFVLPAITLLLKPSAAQQADLNQLLEAQRNPASPSYRRWLTPEQYADRFGASASDLAKIAAWLEAQGFTVGYTARARNFISFSGTAQQVANAFGTQIHTYSGNGAVHYSNATDPSIPAALDGLVSGIRGLNDYRPKPHYRKMQPQMTLRGYGTVVGPTDFAKIFDLNSLYSAGITGTGQKIAIVAQSEIHTSDITNFRNTFGLGAPNLTMVPVPARLGGPNPGYSEGDEMESDLDVEWSGAVAKDAMIYFVYANMQYGGVWTSAQYIIDEDLAPVLSMSYGSCEQSDLADLASEQALVQQGNAEGITFLAASGDSGAADCDLQSDLIAEAGLAVDAPAAIPEVTAMGGTEFNEGSGNYWPNGAASGYIPEMVWNETALSNSYGYGLASGGGGASVYFTQPPWQNGLGLMDGMRHVPDIAFPAASYHDPFYLYSSDPSFAPPDAGAIGGTSCAGPTMAGIVALANQYLLKTGAITQAGLGNINPALYQLAKTNGAAFHDITVGDNIQPCAAGTLSCVNGYLGWAAGPGYDSASGLGSVDAYNLVHAWNTALATQALVVPSLDSTPEFETAAGSNLWTFTLILTEEAGFATTVTGLGINGVSLTTAQIQSLFGTTTIPAYGQIWGTYSLRGLDISSGKANVTFTVSGGSGSSAWSNTITAPFTGPVALLALNAMTNAASYQQAFAPGAIINLWGTGLGSDAETAAAGAVSPLPEYLGGVTIYAYNLSGSYEYAVPLFYVSPGQVNMQLPYELTAGSGELLVYSSWNSYGTTYDFTVSSAAPGIFSYADTGIASSPIGSGSARVGQEVAIYVTGAGQVNPLPSDGLIPDYGTTPAPRQAVSATVGGVPVTSFQYKGIPSWSVGVLQLNFTIPSGVAVGQQPLVVTIGGVASLPANIVIAQ
jgi:uncharacterized protein (TIGR03437 family)